MFFSVNFKKNEKNFDASTSAVLRMVQEADKEPKEPESGGSYTYTKHYYNTDRGYLFIRVLIVSRIVSLQMYLEEARPDGCFVQ